MKVLGTQSRINDSKIQKVKTKTVFYNIKISLKAKTFLVKIVFHQIANEIVAVRQSPGTEISLPKFRAVVLWALQNIPPDNGAKAAYLEFQSNHQQFKNEFYKLLDAVEKCIKENNFNNFPAGHRSFMNTYTAARHFYHFEEIFGKTV